ncbi:MAG: hypothetical protein LC098_10640 [Burkholderiales bacterium]|uniref:hypothetical protein n=1 Tax=Dokdonella sp. TaxID=2291710 RepID=UPI0027BACE3D|nr:hypothetical protein [Dokdonella sp.]MCZ2135866.1 hypothetical protein [Burkholderiales bacterium]
MKTTPKKGAAKQPAKRYGDGRAAFLGHVEAIQSWIDEGRTLRSYFDQAGDLGITYSQFVRHARTYIRRSVTRRNPHERFEQQAGQGQSAGHQPAGKPVVGQQQFRHSAVAGDDDKLI